MLKAKKIIFSAPMLACAAAALFSACVSFKNDILLNGGRDQSNANLTKLEEAIVPLEASRSTDARMRQSEITSARQLINGMEREASADADYSGRLTAWSGRLAILEGRYTEATRLYRQSIAASPGNITAVVLGIRLEGDPSKRLEIIEREIAITGHQSTGIGELYIERGRSLYELNRFSEAAGAFDTAFSSGLGKVYIDNYTADRTRAWELRNTSGVGAGTLNVLSRDTITWNDCITIAKNETQLLRFLTGGRTISDADLFARLLERDFIPVVQDIAVNEWPQTRPAAGDTVTRAGAAWFIWHLYAEARADRGMLTRYSARYATGANPRSPITDVPPLSPFFDSIIGSVETELLSLPDGRNFRPDQFIRGAELLTILKRIDG